MPDGLAVDPAGLRPVLCPLADRQGQRRPMPLRRTHPRPGRTPVRSPTQPSPLSACLMRGTSTPGSCPGACSSAPPSPARWPATRCCCSWTSRSARSTPQAREDPRRPPVLLVRRERIITILVVTHDIDESVYLGDRVIRLTRDPAASAPTCRSAPPAPRDQIETKELPESSSTCAPESPPGWSAAGTSPLGPAEQPHGETRTPRPRAESKIGGCLHTRWRVLKRSALSSRYW